jgi:AraC family transcriptional regulator, L-arginine-responsive activator
VWPGTHPATLMPALAVLRSANRMAPDPCYAIDCYTLDDQPVISDDGWQLPARPWTGQIDGAARLWLVADNAGPPDSVSAQLALQLKGLDRDGTALGAVEAGVFALALSGLLDTHRCAVHWRLIDEFRDLFPGVQAGTQLYEIDHGRATACGGHATTDLFLALVAEEQSQDLAALVAEDLVLERIREGSERQRIPLRNRLGATHPKLTQAVILMESNIEEPLTTDEIARHVCVSRRQLERIFKQYLNSVPSQYYLELRLNRARQMLLQTSKSIIQIGLSCGFSSGPHFSSAYRNCFGITPREDRNQRRAQQAMEQ